MGTQLSSLTELVVLDLPLQVFPVVFLHLTGLLSLPATSLACYPFLMPEEVWCKTLND